MAIESKEGSPYAGRTVLLGTDFGRNIYNEVARLGIDDVDEAIVAWGVSARSLEAAVRFNLKTLRAMGDCKPSAATVLAKEYGILNFGRYPEEALIDQFERRFDNCPYVVWVNPYFDSNGAFYKFGDKLTHPIEVLHKKLRKIGFNLRFIEYGDRKSFIRRFHDITERFGPAAAGVLGGHGNRTTLALHYGEDKYFDISDLQKPRDRNLKNFLVENPTIILLSCFSGTEGGIGQHLSEALDAKVIAPRYSTSLDRIWPVVLNDGRLDLQVQYTHDTTMRNNDYPLRGEKNIYIFGQLQVA